MSMILITKLYNFTYKYRTKILNSYYCECINKPNINNTLCIQKNSSAGNNNPNDQCEKCQKIIDLIFGDGKIRESVNTDYQDVPDIRTMDGAELAQIITQAQMHPETKQEKYQRIISQVFGSTEDNASNAPIALEELKLLPTLNSNGTSNGKYDEDKLITKIETVEEANVVILDKKQKQDETNIKKQTANLTEPLVTKNITKDITLDIELKLCEIADHCLPDHIDGRILKEMKDCHGPKTTVCEKHNIVPPLSFVVNNVINNDSNNNQYLFKKVGREGSNKQTVIKRQQVIPKPQPNIQNTEPSPIPTVRAPIPQKQSGELDKLEPTFQPAITDKPLSCVGYTENNDSIIIYMEECLSQPREKVIKTCDEIRIEEFEKQMKLIYAEKRDINKETFTNNASACKLKTNEDEISIEPSSIIMNQAKELAENLTVLTSDSNDQLSETIVVPKHRKGNETRLHTLQVNNVKLQEQRKIKPSVGKNTVIEAELDDNVLTKKEAFDKAMKNIISANAAQLSPKEKEEEAFPVEKEKPKEDKELSLQELLQRVRRRHRMQYCQQQQRKVDPEGKCGDKKPPCPPPPKECPPPPPPPACPAPCPKPTPAPECPPPPKCPPDPPCPKPKCFKKINENVDLILIKMYQYQHNFCSILDKSTTNTNFVEVIAKLVGRVKVAAEGCEKIIKETVDDILDNVLFHEYYLEVNSCLEKVKLDIGPNLEIEEEYILEDRNCWTRGFEPWTPIPSWPYPKKVHKEPICPKVGCRTRPPKLTDRCKEKPCMGFPKNR